MQLTIWIINVVKRWPVSCELETFFFSAWQKRGLCCTPSLRSMADNIRNQVFSLAIIKIRPARRNSRVNIWNRRQRSDRKECRPNYQANKTHTHTHTWRREFIPSHPSLPLSFPYVGRGESINWIFSSFCLCTVLVIWWHKLNCHLNNSSHEK